MLGGLQAIFLSQESCDPVGVGFEGSDLNPNPQASKPITPGPRELARSPKQTWHHKRGLTKATVFQDEIRAAESKFQTLGRKCFLLGPVLLVDTELMWSLGVLATTAMGASGLDP